MNILTNFREKIYILVKVLCKLSHFLYYFILLEIAITHKFRYSFEKNENSQILFFLVKMEYNMLYTLKDIDYELRVVFGVDLELYNKKDCVFTYEKENFISFKILNDFLLQTTAENKYKNGIIECNFELSYFLKLSKDIAIFPFELNNIKFKCILVLLKHLKAVENKQQVEYLQIFISNYFVNRRNYVLENHNLNLEEIYKSGFFSKIDFSIKKSLFSGFLNSFMLKFIFEDENLILLENIKDSYDTSLFDEYFPYKNLVINNFKVFCTLENVLKYTHSLATFQILLNILNIRSLIINKYQEFDIPDINFNFFIFSNSNFKSLTVSNFVRSSSSVFLEKMCNHIGKNMEYMRFINSIIFLKTLSLFLENQRLKGIVLNNASVFTNEYFMNDYTYLNETLEYICVKNFKINSTWWKDFFERANIYRIILSFSDQFSQDSFLYEFYTPKSCKNVSYFEIEFYYTEIPVGFSKALLNFKSLKTFKISRYKPDKSELPSLFESIRNMPELKNLTIRQCNIGTQSYIQLFKLHKIRFLQIENLFEDKKILIFDFNIDLLLFSKLVLIYIKINLLSLLEIFKLKHLIDLSLKFCSLEFIENLKSLDLFSTNIRFLDFHGTNLEGIKKSDILIEMDCLEELDLSKCRLPHGFLSKLSWTCNLRLKKLSFQFGTFNFNDLNRISQMEVLEELNLSNCIFIEGSFCMLGSDCKCFNTLKSLYLTNVKIDIKDIFYLNNFRNLKILSLTPLNFDIYTLKKCLIILPIYQLITNMITEEYYTDILNKYLYEVNIYMI